MSARASGAQYAAIEGRVAAACVRAVLVRMLLVGIHTSLALPRFYYARANTPHRPRLALGEVKGEVQVSHHHS